MDLLGAWGLYWRAILSSRNPNYGGTYKFLGMRGLPIAPEAAVSGEALGRGCAEWPCLQLSVLLNYLLNFSYV